MAALGIQSVPRYRFRDFILSPRRRMLVHGVHERPLIPRYFDLLVFLIERRNEAVHRRDIFDRVWNDVIVSDSALSQAIRTIRRTLGDDSRAPRFIRTVSRRLPFRVSRRWKRKTTTTGRARRGARHRHHQPRIRPTRRPWTRSSLSFSA
jgi:DNA-binding winged helix-turn-helix (wHTH) protein